MQKITRLVLVVSLLASFAVATAPSAVAQRGNPANGVWTAIDPVDGSNLTLVVAGNMRRGAVLVFDDNATIACPPDNPALAFGRGRWTGNTLNVTVRIRCFGTTNPSPVALAFVYDASSDTITSGAEVYSRL